MIVGWWRVWRQSRCTHPLWDVIDHDGGWLSSQCRKCGVTWAS